MHPRILAQRTALAREKLAIAAGELAGRMGLERTLVDALQPQTNNPQVRQLMLLEACAELVQAAADSLAVVSTETLPAELETLVIETPEGEITVEASVEVETLPAELETEQDKKPARRRKRA
ncbi:MAG: hypothetical protein ACOYYS_09990 [Chloroflexota bacterium]